MNIEKWQGMPRDRQLLNIASELSRIKHWLKSDDQQAVRNCLDRVFELVDLTVEAESGIEGLSFRRELLRFREALAAYYSDISEEKEDMSVLFEGLLNLNPAAHSLRLRI